MVYLDTVAQEMNLCCVLGVVEDKILWIRIRELRKAMMLGTFCLASSCRFSPTPVTSQDAFLQIQ